MKRGAILAAAGGHSQYLCWKLKIEQFRESFRLVFFGFARDLLIVQCRLRRGFVELKLCAHFLNLRRLLFQLYG